MPDHESRLSRPRRAAGRVVEVLSSRPVAFVPATILALAAVATTTRCSALPSAPRNVVMVSVDTLRAANLGVHGYPRDTSPSLDRLAARSVVFRHAFTPWPKTTPAIASLMASQYAHRTGVMRTTPHQRVGDRVLLLAEVLSDHGFFNLGVVSNAAVGPRTNISQGFDRYELASGLNAARLNRKVEARLPELLERQREGTPTLLWVHYIDPHAPYTPPRGAKRFVDDPWYDPSARVTIDNRRTTLLPIDPTLEPMERRRRVAFNRPNVGRATRHPLGGDTVLANYVAAYDAEIRFVDTHVGRLLDRLERIGVLDNSIVIFWADHGESLGEHNYYFAHGRFAYKANLHVPLMISAPHLEPRVVDSPVSLIDVAPTILDFLGIPIPDSFEGTSLYPSLRGDPEEDRDIFAEAGYAVDYQKVLIRWPWKLIHIPDPIVQGLANGKEFELYNLERDPGELDEAGERHPGQLEAMRNDLRRWVAGWSDSIAEPEEAEADPEVRESLRALGYIE